MTRAAYIALAIEFAELNAATAKGEARRARFERQAEVLRRLADIEEGATPGFDAAQACQQLADRIDFADDEERAYFLHSLGPLNAAAYFMEEQISAMRDKIA